MTGGGSAPRIFHRRRRSRRRQTGLDSNETAHSLDRLFSGFTGVSHFTCDLC